MDFALNSGEGLAVCLFSPVHMGCPLPTASDARSTDCGPNMPASRARPRNVTSSTDEHGGVSPGRLDADTKRNEEQHKCRVLRGHCTRPAFGIETALDRGDPQYGHYNKRHGGSSLDRKCDGPRQ